jgi:hypothetical protein
VTAAFWSGQACHQRAWQQSSRIDHDCAIEIDRFIGLSFRSKQQSQPLRCDSRDSGCPPREGLKNTARKTALFTAQRETKRIWWASSGSRAWSQRGEQKKRGRCWTSGMSSRCSESVLQCAVRRATPSPQTGIPTKVPTITHSRVIR